jgi:hypothetical protein
MRLLLLHPIEQQALSLSRCVERFKHYNVIWRMGENDFSRVAILISVLFNTAIPLLMCYDCYITVYLLLSDTALYALEQAKED